MIDVVELIQEVQALELEMVQNQEKLTVMKETLLELGITVTKVKVKVPVINLRKEEAIKLWKAGKHKRIDIARQLKVSAKTITKYLKEEESK